MKPKGRTKEMEMTNQRQWTVVEDGKLVHTHGREKGAMLRARAEARERRQRWTGAKAILLTQDEIDRLD
jgi:hypothetical protein